MKKRNSSLELLRIICMFLIIMHHYSVHGGYEAFTYDNINAGRVFVQLSSMFGRISCSIFAIVTGYFMINNVAQNHYKKIIALIIKMFFYSFGILCILAIIDMGNISIGYVIKLCFPVFWGGWYVITYIMMCLIIPFINPYICSLDKHKFEKLLVVLVILWSVIPTFSNQAYDFGNIDFFVVMYLIGAYIRLYVKDKIRYKNKWNLLIACISIFLIILSVIVIDGIGVVIKSNRIISMATYFREYNTILALVCAVSVFMFFMNIEFNNRVINAIAGTTLGVYLIHDNILLRVYIWKRISPNVDFVDFPYFHMVAKVILVFVICVMVDFIYNKTLARVIENTVEKKCKF